MIHIKGTISFEKEDNESLLTVQEALLSYNLMSRMYGAKPIPSELCDLGNGNHELRFDFDYDPTVTDEMLKLAKRLQDFNISI